MNMEKVLFCTFLIDPQLSLKMYMLCDSSHDSVWQAVLVEGWHDLDNTDYDCWPLEKPDEYNMLDCGGKFLPRLPGFSIGLGRNVSNQNDSECMCLSHLVANTGISRNCLG